eukprot:TRINITY_DN5740_c1_g1_i2.p1 TRINITY_DN5740_c1_g1~~TRINITY_DN5740_c1_g1_i2.p1  ORF type:complete len:888 (+),score=341.97 TRINITY_DN5740_c1_g1_i2:105-2768(+)
MGVLAPERAYQRLGKEEVPSDNYFKDLCNRGLYCFVYADKLNRKGGGNKPAVLLVTVEMVILCTMEGIMMRSLMLRDIEKVLYVQEHPAGDVRAAIIPYRTVSDPAIMVRLGGADPLHSLRVMNYVRQSQNTEPLKEEKITQQSLQRLSSTVSFKRPDDYMKQPWLERKLSVDSSFHRQSPDSSPRSSSPRTLKAFNIDLPSSTSAVGLSFSITNQTVQVTGCDEGGPSQKAGLRAGHIITKIGNMPVSSHEEIKQAVDLAKAASSGPPIRIQVIAYHPNDTSLPMPPAPASAASSNLSAQSEKERLMEKERAIEKAMGDRERELKEREKQLTEREQRLAVAKEAEEISRSRRETDEVLRSPKSPKQGAPTFSSPSPYHPYHPPSVDGSHFEDSSEMLFNDDSITDVIDRHMMQRAGPAILPAPQVISFYVNDDLIEFIPEADGICEYINKVKVGVATALTWNPENRILHDQNGNGGTIPREDPRLLEKIAAFCDVNNLPLTVLGDGFSVQFRTQTNDVLRYTAHMGRLGVFVNGAMVGYAVEIVYNELHELVTDQAGSGGKLPDVGKVEILSKLAKLCDACDVPHNIDADTMLTREAQKTELAELRKSNEELKQRYIQEVEKEQLAAEEKNKLKAETEKLEEEHRARLAMLDDRERRLLEKERELGERERKADEANVSAAAIYRALHHLLNDAPVVPEDDVVGVIAKVKNGFHWYDICEYFQEDGDDLPALLRGLSDRTVVKVESVLEAKGIRLKKAAKKQPQKTLNVAKHADGGVGGVQRVVPSSFNPTHHDDDAFSIPEQQLANTQSTDTRVPTFRRTLTTPAVPPPSAYSHNPNPPSVAHPVFNTPTFSPTPHPVVEYIPEAVSPTFSSPRVSKTQLETMTPV